MAGSRGEDAEILHLIDSLMREHGDSVLVARLLGDFADTCSKGGLHETAARFRAAADRIAGKAPPAA
jgi:hypothetical protein